MKRFTFAAVAALAIGLTTAATADAQYAYRFYNTTPNGGVVVTNNYGNWGAYGANRTYVSPFGGVYQRSYYGDVFGNSVGRSYGYNPLGGYGYNRGFGYNPYNPLGGYNYNFYRRW
ncbi:hypothetical protein GobsT_07450 [Gemmata obscuriglobus]|uniref:Uncharacterized protein n=2 Tax=Gemmata TaxID=113 RepID=A0A2Z3H1S1_9BACT|nr:MULTISPECIES: hypothetical protein [Gemmata]AWM40719.1 hypothetical protein C1280_29530 [Gemmata obscuriglobus]MDY3552342.1 hypothetical protein [Gemmata algarum]MDY3559500.1 hypothetical protein [Gemmata algarum]QEG26010.1 hypothetical protein GobsT_07450 [Gemmata obscuriglobus]VTS00311.1 unnamed protein product [Gemmata obscuriglobus UQM 2246]